MTEEKNEKAGTEPTSEPEESAKEAPAEMVVCAVSKKEVPLEETVEIERKKGEMLRIHSRYKKFD